MDYNVTKYINHIMNHHTHEFAAELLENYTKCYIKDFINRKNNGENIARCFGELAFLYSKKEINMERIHDFILELFNDITDMCTYLAQHLSNFMEIVLYYNPELMDSYLELIQHKEVLFDVDDISILYSAIVFPAVKNKMNIDDMLSKTKYTWRSYNLLSSYYSYRHNNIQALNCAIKAAKSCPAELKSEYEGNRINIVQKILQ